MKKRYKVRFYKAHDIDLITYMASHTINIRMTLYYVVRAYCNGQVMGIRIPEHTGQRPAEYNKIYYTDLCLDTEKDKKLIDFMEGIKPGYRNNFLKNLLRQYLCTPLVEDFLVSPSDYTEVEKTTQMLQGDRTMVDLDYEAYKKKSRSQKRTKRVSERPATKKPVVKEKKKEKQPASTSYMAERVRNEKLENPLYAAFAQLAKGQGMSETELDTLLSSLKEKSNRQTSETEEILPAQEPTTTTAIEKDMLPERSVYTEEQGGWSGDGLETERDGEDDDLTDAFAQILSL